MFPLDQTVEICFGIPPSTTLNAEVTTPQQDSIFDLLQEIEQVETISDISTPQNHRRKRPLVVGANNIVANKGKKGEIKVTTNIATSPDKSNLKKMAHRDIERQRRQEMTKLLTTLRSTIPPEFIKAKRSATDNMLDAVDYIKHMEKRTSDLKVKRDKLRKSRGMVDAVDNDVAVESSTTTAVQPPNTVSLRSCYIGVEILIDSCLIEEGFPLSKVFKVLSQEGLIVVSFLYSKINERLRHVIQIEVSDQTLIDLSVLQEKLTRVMNS